MHQLPELKYSYADLEPYIDEETMCLHHTKHHQTYIDKLNAALETTPEIKDRPLEELLANLETVPEIIRPAVRNHGGGHFNHSLWWEIIGPAGSGAKEPIDELAQGINQRFGSVKELQAKIKDQALSLFGSGWVWLVADSDNKLSIMTTSNQDTPLSSGLRPILGIDVWEHAYYLKYQNRRADYLEAVFAVLNWENINNIFIKK